MPADTVAPPLNDATRVERRSIEFIPHEERYGTPRRLFTLWFSVNMQITAFVIGALGVVAGLNIFWALVAIVVGTAIGAIFMAGHSAQGPHLGVPQMIQSRAQFGVYGAGLPLLVMVLSYSLFTAANAVLMRTPIQQALPLSDNSAIAVFSVMTLFIAFVGYELIHRLAAWMSIVSLLLFAAAGVLAAFHPFPANAWQPVASGLHLKAFMIALMSSASWAIGYAPLVADYSRYLPADVKTSATFWYSYWGLFCGSVFVMVVAAMIAAFSPGIVEDPAGAVAGLFSGEWRWLIYVLIVVGVLQANVMNVYSAYMSGTTIFTGFKGVSQISRRTKFFVMALATAGAAAVASATQYHFFDYFSDIIFAQLYVTVPWTSINLCDFYLVRRGRYDVAAIYDTEGEYGKYNAGTMLVFILSLAVQIPFMDLSFYKGPVARYFGTDVTMYVSILFPGLFYYLVNMKTAARSRELERRLRPGAARPPRLREGT